MVNTSQQATPRADVPAAEYDVIIIGAGVTGLYQLYRIRELGLSVRVYDDADGVGGTWNWNRYPGCRFDSESETYGYSWSEELLQEWDWKEHFSAQPDTERYMNYVADKFDLRRDIQLSARVKSAIYNQQSNRWHVELTSGERVRAQFVIGAVGIMSADYTPDFAGIGSFKGLTLHTGRWPKQDVDLAGKRVAVIGTGPTGVSSSPKSPKWPVISRCFSAHQTTARRCAMHRFPRKRSANSKRLMRRSTNAVAKHQPVSGTTSIHARPWMCRKLNAMRATKNCGNSLVSPSG